MTPQEQNQTVGLSVEDEVLHSQDIATEKRKFPESLVVFAKHKLLIEWFVGTAIVLSVVVSLLLPKSYTATARILPLHFRPTRSVLLRLGALRTGLPRDQPLMQCTNVRASRIRPGRESSLAVPGRQCAWRSLRRSSAQSCRPPTGRNRHTFVSTLSGLKQLEVRSRPRSGSSSSPFGHLPHFQTRAVAKLQHILLSCCTNAAFPLRQKSA